MSDEIEALLLAGTRPLKSHPTARDIFGDTRAFPVFDDICALCDVILRKRSLAWPMRFAFPPAPPDPPDFAALACVYCNHLAHAISPHLGDATRSEPPSVSEVTGLLTFLVLSAYCLSGELPSGISATAYLEQVKAKLIESARIMRPDDEPYWESVASACGKVVRSCAEDQLPKNEQDEKMTSELSKYLSTLIGQERAAKDEAPVSVYQQGACLVERVARSMSFDVGGVQPPPN